MYQVVVPLDGVKLCGAQRSSNALEGVIAALVERQAADAAAYEAIDAYDRQALDPRADEILAAISARQRQLRAFREQLLHNGIAVSGTWLPRDQFGGGA